MIDYIWGWREKEQLIILLCLSRLAGEMILPTIKGKMEKEKEDGELNFEWDWRGTKDLEVQVMLSSRQCWGSLAEPEQDPGIFGAIGGEVALADEFIQEEIWEEEWVEQNHAEKQEI